MNTRQQPSIDASVCRVALTGRGTKRKMNHSQHGPQTALRSALPRRNDTSRRHNNIGRHKQQPMKENTTHDLEKLLLEEPKDIVISLTQDTKRLQNMLKDTGKTTQDLFLLLQVLGKASRCTFAPQNQIHLLNTIIESRLFTFISRELSTIYIYVMRGIFDNKSEAMIRHILTLLKAILNIMPTKFLEIASAVDLLNVIAKSTSTSESGVVIDPVVIQEIHALQEDRSQVMADVRIGQTQPESEQLSEDHQSWHPPENFRSISVFPTSSDIRANVEPFLRPNIAIGPFRDTEHYLDVHFRLLREDFIQPLRKGIQEYLSQQSHPRKKHSRLTDIRVYEEVFILSPMCRDFDGICHMVQFHNGCLKRIRWKSSKRLIYGSLVCLSKDNFNTAHFATVAHREPKQLESGFLALKFHSLEDVIYELPDQPYKMVESNAYFESYRYVLEGLQDLNTNSLPFREYLVECEKEVRIPAYINSEDVTYTLCNDSVTKSQSISAPVLDTSSWPTSRELGLDESQLQALKTALTKELAIIQGPPGTGKTYIGLEIVKILLDNHKVWSGTMNPPAPSPILIVCYTNHALDQFLEGINKFQGTEIVRVGGRSKSEALEKSLISEKRKKGGVVGRLILRELKEYQERILTWTEKHRFNPSCMIYCQNLCVPQQHRHSLLTVKPGKSRWQLNDEQSILDYWLMEKIRDATNSKQMHMEYPNSDSTKLAAAIENDDDEDDNRILVEFETDFLADQRYLEGDWTQDLIMGQQHTDTNDSTY
uniref:NFX1-type zinc finger-containing protein 1-like n=1 Tax=Saccoglossus kowalevskii TaxID=10224 RepID=A0ABM0N1E6_SACKO